MYRQVKYAIGEKVDVVYVPQEENDPILIDQKLGLVHKIPSLDPRMFFFIPLGPKPLKLTKK